MTQLESKGTRTHTKHRAGWEQITLAVIVVAGLAARLYEIPFGFGHDEIFSVRVASLPFAEVIKHALADTAHPPLHIALLHPWLSVLGASEIAARSLSIVFSAAFLLTSYALFRRLVPAWLALGLVAILALSPEFVYQGQRARPYALIAFLASANLLSFVRVLEAPDERKRVVIWAVSSALWVYSQYLAALLIACQIGVALLRLRAGRIRIIAYGLGATAVILPWLIAAMGNSIWSGNDALPGINWMSPPTRTDLVWFYVSTFGDPPGIRVRWLLATLAIPAAAYLVQLARRGKLPASHPLLVVTAACVPIIVWAVSVWGPKPVFAARQLMGAAIAFVALVGLGLATLPRALAVVVLLALLAWTIAGLPDGFPHNSKPPWRDVASEIDTLYGSTTVVVQEADVGFCLRHYRRAGSVRLWGELAEEERLNEFLFVCRPHICSDVETDALRSRRTLEKTWQWGRSNVNVEHRQLSLYEIRSDRLQPVP